MDKSRQQFEEWFAPQKEEIKNNGLGMISITRMYQRQLSAWKASRESLEVELPQRKGICHNEYESGYFDGIDKCEDVLIRSGVKIKNG